MKDTLIKIIILFGLGVFFVYGASMIFYPVKSYIVDLQQESIHFFIPKKGDLNGHTLFEIREQLQKDGLHVTMAMNGGMFTPLFQPVGFTVIDRVTIHELVTKKSGYGNFFLQPNGVFWVSENNAGVMTTDQAVNELPSDIRYATQSGPMLIIDGTINPLFKKNSDNKEIRNGVCSLDDTKIMFAISRRTINLYDFAKFFESQGCINALYLDGSISKAYIPSQFFSTDGNLGMIIASFKK